MDERFDTVIVGAGLAGAAAACVLSAGRRVLVVEADGPAAGGSGAAAGLVNPLMGRRPRPAPDVDADLDALHALLDDADAAHLFYGGGVLRPAVDAEQRERFREAAGAFPEHGAWLAADAVRARHPDVAAPHGALFVPCGGAVEVPRLVAALLAAAERRGGAVRRARATGWRETADRAVLRLRTDDGEATGEATVQAGHVLLAPGGGYAAFPAFDGLPFHRVKGQTVRVAPPAGLDRTRLPHLAGRGYVAVTPDALVLGSTYEHAFDHLDPTPAATRAILDKAARLLPALRDAEVLGAAAGVRVTTPPPRTPRLGPLPGCRRVWAFLGLGSRGLLGAPRLARALPDVLAAPDALPGAWRLA